MFYCDFHGNPHWLGESNCAPRIEDSHKTRSSISWIPDAEAKKKML